MTHWQWTDRNYQACKTVSPCCNITIDYYYIQAGVYEYSIVLCVGKMHKTHYYHWENVWN